MGAGEAGDEVEQRLGHGVGECGRETLGQGDPQRVAEPGGILGGGEALLGGHTDDDGPALADEGVEPLPDDCGGGCRLGCVGAGLDLPAAERAEDAQQVVDLVGVAGPASVGEALELELEVGEHDRVDELAQLLGSEQLA